MNDFEGHVLDKLDKITQTQAEHGERLATLEERLPKPPSKLRDGTFVISGGAVAALLSFLAQHWSSAK
jgi:hypothetical protein